MKMCIFSGTFNPIHNGHIYIAEYILRNFDFSKILFIPALNPPLKESNPKMAVHRFKMVELAIASNPKFEISDVEYRMRGKSYSYNTICELYKEYKVDGKINFILGTDAFETLDNWYESEKLRKLLNFIVFVRKNDFDENKYSNMKEKGYSFEFAKMQFNDISSTEIRKRINENLSLAGLLPEKVERYIKENGLYKNQ